MNAADEHRILANSELLTLRGGIRHAVEALEDSAFVITIVSSRKASWLSSYTKAARELTELSLGSPLSVERGEPEVETKQPVN